MMARAKAKLQAQLPAKIAELNAEPGASVQIVAPQVEHYHFGPEFKPKGADSFPYLEIGAPRGTLDAIDLGSNAARSSVPLWIVMSVLDVDPEKLTLMAYRYLEALIEVAVVEDFAGLGTVVERAEWAVPIGDVDLPGGGPSQTAAAASLILQIDFDELLRGGDGNP